MTRAAPVSDHGMAARPQGLQFSRDAVSVLTASNNSQDNPA